MEAYPSHTLYINVTTKLPIQKLVREIRDSQRLMKLDNEHKPHFLDDPHLTIARKLLPWQYEKGWLEYSIVILLAVLLRIVCYC